VVIPAPAATSVLEADSIKVIVAVWGTAEVTVVPPRVMVLSKVNVSTSSPVCVKITLSPISLSFATELCKIPEQVDK